MVVTVFVDISSLQFFSEKVTTYFLSIRASLMKHKNLKSIS